MQRESNRSKRGLNSFLGEVQAEFGQNGDVCPRNRIELWNLWAFFLGRFCHGPKN